MKRALLAASAALFLVGLSPAPAAVTPNSLVTGQSLRACANHVATGALGPVVVCSGGTNWSKCFAGWSSNTDSSGTTDLLTIDLFDGTNAYKAVGLTIIANAGVTSGNATQALTTPSVWAGLAVDGNGVPYVAVPTGWSIRATASAVSTGLVNVVFNCVDF